MSSVIPSASITVASDPVDLTAAVIFSANKTPSVVYAIVLQLAILSLTTKSAPLDRLHDLS